MGIQTNTRSPKIIAAFGGENCSGPSDTTESCNVQECPGTKLLSNDLFVCPTMFSALINFIFTTVVDCEWGDWEVSDCSKECGGGIQFKTRIETVIAAYGGQECSGQWNVTESCNTQNCPGKIEV